MREVEFQGRELHLLAIIMTDEDDYEAQLAALERELQQDQHSGDLDSNVSMEDLKALEASLEQEDEGTSVSDVRHAQRMLKRAALSLCKPSTSYHITTNSPRSASLVRNKINHLFFKSRRMLRRFWPPLQY